ncbi:glycosyltransferase family 2 protein [Cadophora sp. DSE1049]|nr:glycosyltransferase family 2 protein [Cadophora sp. DSE1049]
MQGRQSATRSQIFTRLASWAVGGHAHRSSLHDLYEKAKEKQKTIRRSPLVQRGFEYTMYFVMVPFIYMVLVGMPLWGGAVYWLYLAVAHKPVIPGGFAITVGTAALYAFAPLFILLDKDPPPPSPNNEYKPQLPCNVALIIPCYKSSTLISATLKAALKLFPPENIFVIANGNSPSPLDNTGDICALFGVSHTWCPLGSKIIAQFVGCKVAEKLPYMLLIDDDCLLPPNFPMGTDWCTERIRCIGYTISSVGPGCTKGTLVQQAQDMEYKLSGLHRQFAGEIGSATFPHGAISMWEERCLVQTFHEHPGFSVSEDWFFGHVARQLGSRILMNSEVFVETETPCAIFFAPKDEARGGFGEMTVMKQRFERWNFFFVNGIYWDMLYIVCNWKLGWWEVGAKFFIFQEVYETLLYLLTPIILPIAMIVRPMFCVILLVATFSLYLLNTTIFNLIHLRRKKKVLPNGEITTHAISTKALAYYMLYKLVLTAVNVASCYWSIYKYGRYFAKRHPKVVEDEKVIEVVLNLDKRGGVGRMGSLSVHSDSKDRRLTIVAAVTRGSKTLRGSVYNNNV